MCLLQFLFNFPQYILIIYILTYMYIYIRIISIHKQAHTREKNKLVQPLTMMIRRVLLVQCSWDHIDVAKHRQKNRENIFVVRFHWNCQNNKTKRHISNLQRRDLESSNVVLLVCAKPRRKLLSFSYTNIECPIIICAAGFGRATTKIRTVFVVIFIFVRICGHFQKPQKR